jgi:hypothetical protein
MGEHNTEKRGHTSMSSVGFEIYEELKILSVVICVFSSDHM